MICIDWLFWFQAAGALGAIATFFAFLFLFKRDKNKEEQLEKLTTITQSLQTLAISQSSIIENMQGQLSEVIYQSSLMKEANEVSKDQFELYSEHFLYQKTSSENQRALDDKKRRNDIKPHFSYTGGGSGIGHKFQNKKGTASNFTLVDKSDGLVTPNLPTYPIEANQELTLHIRSEYVDVTNLNGHYTIGYTDEDGNQYHQRINVINGRCSAKDPDYIAPIAI